MLCRLLIRSDWKHHVQASNITTDIDKWPGIQTKENNGGIQNDVPSGTAEVIRNVYPGERKDRQKTLKPVWKYLRGCLMERGHRLTLRLQVSLPEQIFLDRQLLVPSIVLGIDLGWKRNRWRHEVAYDVRGNKKIKETKRNMSFQFMTRTLQDWTPRSGDWWQNKAPSEVRWYEKASVRKWHRRVGARYTKCRDKGVFQAKDKQKWWRESAKILGCSRNQKGQRDWSDSGGTNGKALRQTKMCLPLN